MDHPHIYHHHCHDGDDYNGAQVEVEVEWNAPSPAQSSPAQLSSFTTAATTPTLLPYYKRPLENSFIWNAMPGSGSQARTGAMTVYCMRMFPAGTTTATMHPRTVRDCSWTGWIAYCRSSGFVLPSIRLCRRQLLYRQQARNNGQ